MARVAIPQFENDALQSEAWATSPWGANAGVVASNSTTDVVDPNGGSAATKIVADGTQGAGGFLVFQGFQLSQTNSPFALGFWARSAAGSFNLQMTDNASAVFHTFGVTTTWQMFQSDDVAPGVFQWQLALYLAVGDAAAKTFYVWGAQVAIGKNRIGPYAKTTAASIPGPIRNNATGRVAVSGRVAASGRITP